MKKVFFDTNVLLDSVLPDRDNGVESSVVLSASDNGLIEGYVSFLSVANSAYILKMDYLVPAAKIAVALFRI